MSWDATLIDDRGHCEGDWNYTHNCNGMVSTALEIAGFTLDPSTQACNRYDRETETWTRYPDGYGTISWWQHLDELPGAEGAAFLGVIITELEADPDRFRAMNPPNGWGDYDSLVKVLRDMRDAVPEWPTVWRCSG